MANQGKITQWHDSPSGFAYDDLPDNQITKTSKTGFKPLSVFHDTKDAFLYQWRSDNAVVTWDGNFIAHKGIAYLTTQFANSPIRAACVVNNVIICLKENGLLLFLRITADWLDLQSSYSLPLKNEKVAWKSARFNKAGSKLVFITTYYYPTVDAPPLPYDGSFGNVGNEVVTAVFPYPEPHGGVFTHHDNFKHTYKNYNANESLESRRAFWQNVYKINIDASGFSYSEEVRIEQYAESVFKLTSLLSTVRSYSGERDNSKVSTNNLTTAIMYDTPYITYIGFDALDTEVIEITNNECNFLITSSDSDVIANAKVTVERRSALTYTLKSTSTSPFGTVSSSQQGAHNSHNKHGYAIAEIKTNSGTKSGERTVWLAGVGDCLKTITKKTQKAGDTAFTDRYSPEVNTAITPFFSEIAAYDYGRYSSTSETPSTPVYYNDFYIQHLAAQSIQNAVTSQFVFIDGLDNSIASYQDSDVLPLIDKHRNAMVQTYYRDTNALKVDLFYLQDSGHIKESTGISEAIEADVGNNPYKIIGVV